MSLKNVGLLLVLVALLLCPAARAAPLTFGKSLVLYSSADVINFGKFQTEEQRLELHADGRWRRTHKLPHPKRGLTTTTISSGVLDKVMAAGFFSKVQLALRRARPGSTFVRAARSRRSTALAIYGLRKQAVFLGQEGRRVSPGLEGLLVLIEALPLKVTEPTGARQRIEQSYWTMAGEGASSEYTFTDKGFFRSKGGGDIGNGYQVKSVVRKVVDVAATRAIFKRVSELVRAKGLAPKPSDLKARYGQDQYYSLVGFGPKPITVREPEVTRSLAALLVPLTRQNPWSRFRVRQVSFNATVPDGFTTTYSPAKKKRVKVMKTRNIEGELFVTGHMKEKLRSGTKQKHRRVSPRRVNQLFGELQELMDQPRHELPRAASATPPDLELGVTFLTVSPFDPWVQSRNFSPRDPGFEVIKALLERTVLRKAMKKR